MAQRNLWFGAAWVLLVLVVTIGFFIQARIIDDLHTTQTELAVVTRNQQRLIMAICNELRDQGIECPTVVP